MRQAIVADDDPEALGYDTLYNSLFSQSRKMATSAEPEYVYSFAEDLFRLGNATSPRLDHVRDTDVDTLERNGIQMVIANGKGISLFNLEELNRRKSRLNG